MDIIRIIDVKAYFAARQRRSKPLFDLFPRYPQVWNGKAAFGLPPGWMHPARFV